MTILPLGEFTESRSASLTMTLLLLPAAILLSAALGDNLFSPFQGLLGAIPCGAFLAWCFGGLSGRISMAFDHQ